jgi:hypothetical protein
LRSPHNGEDYITRAPAATVHAPPVAASAAR